MKYILFGGLILTLCLNSCLEDNTNLDYLHVVLPDSIFVTNPKDGKRINCKLNKEINEIYKIAAGEELQLNSEIFYQGNDELTYEWRFGDEQKVISTEKDLRHICTETGALMLMVYRKNGGNAVCCLFNVVISTSFTTGVAILGEEDKGARLDFIQVGTNLSVKVNLNGQSIVLPQQYYFKEHYDLFPLYNNNEVLNIKEPVKIARYSGSAWVSLTGIQLLDKQWKNSVTLDCSTMKKMTEMRDEFIGEPENFRAKDFIPVGVMNLLQSETGKVYTRINYDDGNPCTGKYSPTPLAYNDPRDVPDKGPVEINADYIVPTTTVADYGPGAIIYEKANKRFLYLAGIGYEVLMGINPEYYYIYNFSNPKISASSEMPNYTDLSNIDKELVAIIGPLSSYSKDYYLLFKKDQNYYLQSNSINVQSYSIPFQFSYSGNSCIDLPANVCSLLDNAGKDFTYKNNRIYFTSGNSLYSMDVNGQDLKTEFEFPQKDKITFSKIMAPWYNLTAITGNSVFNGRVFAAAFENGDFKVVQMYLDPEQNKLAYRFLVDKHYTKGVKDVLYYER